eukprot:g14912.t1
MSLHMGGRMGDASSEPVPDMRILKRKVTIQSPAMCPYAHACSLARCPFQHGRTILAPTMRLPRLQYQRCANDDCHARCAKPGEFCCNPCEAEYTGGDVRRLIKVCPAHSGPCKGTAGRHCQDWFGEGRDLRFGRRFPGRSKTPKSPSARRILWGGHRWTPSELEILVDEASTSLKPSWKQISLLLNVHPLTCRDKYRDLCAGKRTELQSKKGPFSEQEDQPEPSYRVLCEEPRCSVWV